MKLFLKIFLLSSSLFFMVSCGSVNELSTKEYASLALHAPLDSGYNTVLYKAKVKLYGNFYSGIFLFKYSCNTKIHNIVFVTEMGLTLFELKFANNAFEVVKTSAFFDNEKAINTLMNDLELLIVDLENAPNVLFVGNKDSKQLKKARKNKTSYYFYNMENQIYRIKRNSFMTSVDVSVNQYDKGFPKKISFDHKRIKLNIDLTLLKQD